jgi:2',3'-cyclic-nucleotide 2'-phosphodiesterase (5'-nucleotidase family)
VRKFLLSITIAAALLWTACSPKHTYRIAELRTSNVKIDADINQADSGLYFMLVPYRDSLNKTMNKVIAQAANTLTKDKPESTLGNLLADATATMAAHYSGMTVDAAFINYGGIRVPSLSEGPVTVGHVYEIMPFDNYLVILPLKGSLLKEFITAVSRSGGWPLSGMSFSINKDGLPENIMIRGKNCDDNTIYNVAMSDYIANGGDNMHMLKDAEQFNTGVLLRDAFLHFFTEKGNKGEFIDASIEGRIIRK